MSDDLRRNHRVAVCCRAVVRDRYGVWTGVTEDVSARGCQVLTSRLLRPGSIVKITLSSDMFPEELEAIGEAAWAAPDRIGIRFVRSLKGPGVLSAQAWFEKLVAQGEMPDSSSTLRLVPSIARVKTVRLAQTSSAGARLRTEEQAPLLTALP